MTFRIAVISPIRGAGATTLSVLLNQYIASQGHSSLLMYTAKDSPVPLMLNLGVENDPTRSVTQITKLLQQGSLRDKDILSYTDQYAPNAYVLNSVDKALDSIELTHIIETLLVREPTRYVTIDVSEDANTKLFEDIVDKSDIVFMVTDPSRRGFEKFKIWMQTPSIRTNASKVFAVVNKFDPIIANVRAMASELQLPTSYVCTLHNNAWLPHCSWAQQMNTVIPQVLAYDPRVAELNNDLNEMFGACGMQVLAKQMKTVKNALPMKEE